MEASTRHSPARQVWALAEAQHGVVARWQLLELGFSSGSIQRRVANGRLHPVMRGVYAIGRPGISRRGRWMAAILSCGPGAVLSHGSAAALWDIGIEPPGWTEVSVPKLSGHSRPGVRAHRRPTLQCDDLAERDGIPLTNVTPTLVDLATRLGPLHLERAINKADKHNLIDPEELRAALGEFRGQAGVALIRAVLDRRTFRLTDSKLEQRFLAITRGLGLPPPLTGQRLNGFEVDFFWPNLGLVVETDGLRYHRTPAQQARDRLRDQAHPAAGLTPLRFTHAQVHFDPEHVRLTLAAVVHRLEGGSGSLQRSGNPLLQTSR